MDARPSPDAGPTLAVDLGGTHLRVALVDQKGSVSARHDVPTPRAGQVPSALVELMAQLAPGADHAVVGLPGAVDYRRGRLEWAPHLPRAWVERLAASDLSRTLGIRVDLANDADLAAVGETFFGAGGRYADVVYLTVSTGIGAGVVLGGRLVHGGRSIAEVGHTVIDRMAFRAGDPCTLEALAAGSSIPELARRAGLGPIDGATLEARTAEGDERAGGVWADVVEAAVIGVVNLVRTFRPEAVIVGGGLGLRPRFSADLRAGFLGVPLPDHPDLLAADLGDDAGLMGGGAWRRAFGD